MTDRYLLRKTRAPVTHHPHADDNINMSSEGPGILAPAPQHATSGSAPRDHDHDDDEDDEELTPEEKAVAVLLRHIYKASLKRHSLWRAAWQVRGVVNIMIKQGKLREGFFPSDWSECADGFEEILSTRGAGWVTKEPFLPSKLSRLTEACTQTDPPPPPTPPPLTPPSPPPPATLLPTTRSTGADLPLPPPRPTVNSVSRKIDPPSDPSEATASKTKGKQRWEGGKESTTKGKQAARQERPSQKELSPPPPKQTARAPPSGSLLPASPTPTPPPASSRTLSYTRRRQATSPVRCEDESKGTIRGSRSWESGGSRRRTEEVEISILSSSLHEREG